MKQSLRFTSVPVVVAAGPGELGAEGQHEVEQRPGQYHNVGRTSVEGDQLPPIANTCRARFDICCYRHYPLSILFVVQNHRNLTDQLLELFSHSQE